MPILLRRGVDANEVVEDIKRTGGSAIVIGLPGYNRTIISYTGLNGRSEEIEQRYGEQISIETQYLHLPKSVNQVLRMAEIAEGQGRLPDIDTRFRIGERLYVFE